MKRVFVLDSSWFENYRDEITAFESALMSLKLVEVEERGKRLLKAAIKQQPGVRLADYELNWLVEQAAASWPQGIVHLAQCHLNVEESTELSEWLNTLSNGETASKLTPSVCKLIDGLSDQGQYEMLLLEE